jgi:hypothetical protein
VTTETVEAAKPILLPAVSADAKRNAFYTKCPEQQSTKPYAMCQYIAANKGDASIKTLYGDCITAISRGRCVAIGMREEEQLKGQAIYFIERVKGAAVVAAQTAWTSPLTEKANRAARSKYVAPQVSTPAPAPKKTTFEFDGNIYAAALNAAVKKESNATNDPAPQPKVTPVAVAPVAPTPVIKPASVPINHVNLTRTAGESPLDFARRVRAAQGTTA